jgi:L-threonylcarbamoyladenylate synthase
MAALPREKGEACLFFSGKSRGAWTERNAAEENKSRGEFSDAGPVVLTLSEDGDVLEAAANLFEYLHRLDGLRPERIHAETLPEEGLGAAVNDRLRRAGAKR